MSKNHSQTHEPIDQTMAWTKTFLKQHLNGSKFSTANVPPFSSVEISINGLCNRSCHFCPRANNKEFKSQNLHLDFLTFKSMIDDLKSNHYGGSIAFSGFCEPLITKNLEEYIEYIHVNLPHIVIILVSNGDFINKERLQNLFKAGLSNLRISLYDGSIGRERFQGMISELGLTSEQVVLRERYYKPAKGYGMKMSNRGGTVSLEDDTINVKPLYQPLSNPCYYPFFKIFIDCDSKVHVCPNDWLKKYVVGSIAENSIYDIWNGMEYTQLRKKLIKADRYTGLCDKCDVDGLYTGVEHFDAWIKYYDTL